METSNVLAAFAALAQETRLAAYRLLVEHAPDGLTAGKVAETLGIAPASLSFHLKELTRAGLIVPRQDGRYVWYRADLDAMNGIVRYLTENCCGSSAVCDPKCAPETRQIAAVRVAPPKRRRSCDPITANLYDASQVAQIPEEAIVASLGCGNPTALAELNPGETVLDLGSGGGIDVLLSARRVGPTGKAYGLDMTGEMLALARRQPARGAG